MPDPNKLEALKKAGFRIREVCGSCDHSVFTEGSPFGTCWKIQYEHQKHTGPPRDAGIHIFGWCPQFSFENLTLQNIRKSGFDIFISGPCTGAHEGRGETIKIDGVEQPCPKEKHHHHDRKCDPEKGGP